MKMMCVVVCFVNAVAVTTFVEMEGIMLLCGVALWILAFGALATWVESYLDKKNKKEDESSLH